MDILEIGAGDALKVLSASAVRKALTEAAATYNANTGCAFTFAFDTSGAIESRVAAGERADLFASSIDSLRTVSGAGVLDGPALIVGSARVALGVRTGERAPDISTLNAFKAALRNAKAIACGDPAGGGTAGKHLAAVFERIGIMEEVAAKRVLRIGGFNVMAAVAEGLADFGITQSTEIAPVKGVEIGGWLPPEAQLTTAYGVAAGVGGAHGARARAFLDWLATPEGSRHFPDAGFFPA